MTSFGKIRVEGRDAAAFLNQVCANEVDVPAGRVVYTQMLNQGRHRKRSDRHAAVGDRVPARGSRRDAATRSRLARAHLGDRFATITDMTAAEAVFCVMGPRRRAIFYRRCSPDDLSPIAFPFAPRARSRSAWASPARTASPTSASWDGSFMSPPIRRPMSLKRSTEAGADHGLKLCGLHALDSCRIEKAFRHFGHDITDEDHVLEAGLGFAVRTQKPDFIGRDAVLRKREEGSNAAWSSSS
jgi:glycine cleavage system aminomethyltransferase T